MALKGLKNPPSYIPYIPLKGTIGALDSLYALKGPFKEKTGGKCLKMALKGLKKSPLLDSLYSFKSEYRGPIVPTFPQRIF